MEFFGLRDFYSLLKMIYDLVARHPRKLQYSNVVKAIQHNFSGRDEEKTRAIFLYHLRRVMDIDHDDAHVSPVLELIEENLSGFPNTERDSRYLLILTENLSALRLLHQIPQLTSATVFFGSNFPEDLEYSQICRR